MVLKIALEINYNNKISIPKGFITQPHQRGLGEKKKKLMCRSLTKLNINISRKTIELCRGHFRWLELNSASSFTLES